VKSVRPAIDAAAREDAAVRMLEIVAVQDH